MYRYFRIMVIGCCLVLQALPAFGQNSEVSLYDSKGKPTAYIATTEDSTIYAWDGNPLAYLYRDAKDIHVYGFNGKHLGWYRQGIIYNHKGHMEGFIEDAVLMFTEPNAYKPIKKATPFRSFRDVAPFKPYFSNTFSKTPLLRFLQEGTDQY